MNILLMIPALFVLASCTDPLDKFISSSAASVCGESWFIGRSIDSYKDNNLIEYNEKSDSYSIDCQEDLSTLYLGLGNDGDQILRIDGFHVSVDKNNRINRMSGTWEEINSKGRRLLGDLKSSRSSYDHSENIEVLERISIPFNDLQRIRYELDRAIGEPHSIRPIEWRTENGSLTIRGYDLTYSMRYMIEDR